MSHMAAATVPLRRVTRRIAHRDVGLRNELQDQHGKSVIERGVRERQGAGVSDLKVDPGIAVLALRMHRAVPSHESPYAAVRRGVAA
jgi:hypothetical protein